MGILRVDPNSEKYRSVWLVGQSAMPNQYQTAFRYAKNIFLSLGRNDLIRQLDALIKREIEDPLGCDLNRAQIIFKNMPFLNSFTRTDSQYVDELGVKIYKWQIQQRFETIMDWVYQQMVYLEGSIRFAAEKPIL
jgi:hypothetical protein